MNYISSYLKNTIKLREMLHLIIILIGILTLLSNCKQETKPVNSKISIPVKTFVTKQTDVNFPIQTSGILSKKSEIKLSFKTGGLISSIEADEGTYVPEGKTMACLNLMEIKAKANQAKLALQKAERDYRRVHNLYKDSVATLEQYQNMGTALEIAKNQHDISEFNLEYSVIRAPADGKVLKRLAEPNEIIAPGHPVFLFSSTKNDWVLRCNLPDRDIVELSLLDTAEVHFDAFPARTFKAILTEMGEWADPYTGTYEVELRMDTGTDLLLSGFIAKALIYPSSGKSVIVIPAGALVHGKGRTGFVYVVKDGKPLLKKVRFNRISNDSLSVEQGLTSGEELITEGNNYIDGSSIIEIKN